MKTTISLSVLALSVSATAFGSQAGGAFAGMYEVVKSDCSPFTLIVGQQNTIVQADETGLRLGSILYTGNGGPDSHPYIQAAFAFKTGTEREGCLGDCYSLYQSAYSADGTEFKSVRLFANTMSAQPVYAGETDFKVNGDELEVDTNDDGQAQAGEQKVCLLKRVGQ